MPELELLTDAKRIGEITIAIMAGCLPMLPAFYKFHFQRQAKDIVPYGPPTVGSATTRKNPKQNGPISISTTELVTCDVQLEDIRQNQ